MAKFKKTRKYKKTRVFKGDDLTKHIDTQSLEFFGNSYKIDSSEKYELIEILWKGRNNIAHGGNLNIFHNGAPIEINLDIVKRISAAVEDFLKWIRIQYED